MSNAEPAAVPSPSPTPTDETPQRNVLRIARELEGLTLTAEVHDDPEDATPYQAKVVDVVRIGESLHFVVVLDG